VTGDQFDKTFSGIKNGATTFSVSAIRITTLSKTIKNTMLVSKMLSIMTLNITALIVKKLSIVIQNNNNNAAHHAIDNAHPA
jgi:hypothetical protein